MDETQSFQIFFSFSVKEHQRLQFWVWAAWERLVLQEPSSIIQKLLRDIISIGSSLLVILQQPLEQDAAQQTFIDIADNTHDPKEVEKVLSLTDNMPLAINLIAHLVDSEGCSLVLSHWEEEKTSLISDGYDRTSNLDLSISLSLSSPRLDTHPHSKNLLSLLSMLPDGLPDIELVQSKLPIDNIMGCKAALTRCDKDRGAAMRICFIK
jgi:hypothetical protein